MKKIVCLLLTGILLAGMLLLPVSCAKKSAGKLICGVTEYEPMNYRDSNGKWTGFDTEFAELVGAKLGMEVEFQLIDWENKFHELDSGAITAIWNGLTATASEDGKPRIEMCDMSYSYMLNTQCVVVRANRAGEFGSIDDFNGKSLAAESGSAGEEYAIDLVGDSGECIGVAAQINSFLEVKTGAVDGAVVDVILARQITGSGDYADLKIAFELDPEVYAVGFKKGSPLRDKVNQAMKELYDSGKLMELEKKYDLDANLVLDTTFGK
ncbi:MAG: transporter substrate-binding domain-containing protein [Oscillospiraceae bacterium]|jgi:polar amino acid transport system substrate-binding protein|nr:transporter substrate-binding domain-containing protein [Oscillospiraceae bacterium]